MSVILGTDDGLNILRSSSCLYLHYIYIYIHVYTLMYLLKKIEREIFLHIIYIYIYIWIFLYLWLYIYMVMYSIDITLLLFHQEIAINTTSPRHHLGSCWVPGKRRAGRLHETWQLKSVIFKPKYIQQYIHMYNYLWGGGTKARIRDVFKGIVASPSPIAS